MNKTQNNDFSLLIKPVSYRCNLNCRYCFYLEKEQFLGTASTMSQNILEQMISDFMSTSKSNYSFAWQGGEPTLAGLDFYRESVRLMQKYGAIAFFIVFALVIVLKTALKITAYFVLVGRCSMSIRWIDYWS